MKQTIKSEETAWIQEVASKEFCFDKMDTLTSETALRIIKLVESKNYKNSESSLSNIFDFFSQWYPISKNNRDKLISFFQNNENNDLWRLILSKVWILTLETNKKFIDTFLYDGEWKANVSQFVEFVVENLTNYPFVIDFDYDEIKEISNWSQSNWNNNRIFKFRKDNKRWLIITSISWEKYVLPEKYEKLEYRRNSTFCWISKWEKWYYWEYIKFEWNEFKVIWRIDNIRDIPNISDSDWNLVYSAIWWKKWLQRFEDTKEWNRILSEKLKPEYDLITIKNLLTFAVKDLEWWKQTVEILSKEYKKIMIFENVSDYQPIEWFDNIFRFKDENWYHYYEINNSWEVKAIQYLQNVKTRIKPTNSSAIFSRFESWKPVFVKYKWDKCCLLVKDWDSIKSHKFEWRHLNISDPKIWLDKKLYSTYKINKEIYFFDINNKKLYKSGKKYRPAPLREFDSIKKDLEEIPLNLFENDIT